uniref:ATP synthase complex subunit 8 n=1 Tax=Tristira magellanica TaxID=353562 RepID=M4JDS6_9ORTH|nr:ATP synthase F0 subunit 8 [Tristira magellanica]AGC22273.1 ATP synthase F0 subunit 8 [Tristira magellanica]
MPQMSPLMWLSLFTLFSMTLIWFNQMNFFSFKIMPIESFKKEMITKMNFNWKW